MKKIVVTIESNNNAVSNAVTLLLRRNSFDCNYKFEINPEYPFQYYLWGIGLIIALSAISVPAGLAIPLGCVSSLLFIAGAILLVKNELTNNAENKSSLNLSPATT